MLMGSDPTSGFGPPPVAGNNFSISISADRRGHTDRLFGLLSQGGNVAMLPQDMFWAAYFGMCVDKFGVNWMLNCETAIG